MATYLQAVITTDVDTTRQVLTDTPFSGVSAFRSGITPSRTHSLNAYRRCSRKTTRHYLGELLISPRYRLATLGTITALTITALIAAPTGWAAPAEKPKAPLAVEALRAIPDLNPFEDGPMIRLRWRPPAQGDRPTAYRVFINGRLFETTTYTSSRILTVTTGTTYNFSVAAVNSVGISPRVTVRETAQVEPTEPLNVSAVPGNNWIDVSWDPPQDSGGTPIQGYRVIVDPSPATPCVFANPTDTFCRIEGLRRNRFYDIEVQAQNAAWPRLQGAESLSVTAMPRSLPSGPRDFTIVSLGSRAVTVSWQPPKEIGRQRILGYQISFIEYNQFGEPEYPRILRSPDPTVLEARITDLTPGVTYDLGIQAYTRTGIGAMTVNVQFMPIGLPARPARVEVIGVGDGAVKVRWEEPDPNGGMDPSAYRITATPTDSSESPVTAICTTKNPIEECDTEFVLTGLTNGVRYSIRVAARNVFGWGPYSTFPAFARPQSTADVR